MCRNRIDEIRVPEGWSQGEAADEMGESQDSRALQTFSIGERRYEIAIEYNLFDTGGDTTEISMF